MRHGKTIWNEQRRTQGHTNNRLSAYGIKTSNVCAENLKNVRFDYIFCSPLCRAVQTANIINKYHNIKIIKDERLKDIDQGFFTGKYFDKLTKEELIAKKNKDKNYNMESCESFYSRIKNFYNFITTKYSDKTILIVTHSGVACNLELIVKKEKFNETKFNNHTFENCEIKKFII